jgi:hypothetical protein
MGILEKQNEDLRAELAARPSTDLVNALRAQLANLCANRDA